MSNKAKSPESIEKQHFQGNFRLAAGEGFEPSQTESESGVLPLHKPAKFETFSDARVIILYSSPLSRVLRQENIVPHECAAQTSEIYFSR
jgi:hypothetical protein